ncbi:MAG TPA: RNA polymerase sigma factor [Bryobacteraceae bacterium]
MRKPRCRGEQNDTELLRLSARGDEEAFLVLYQRHQAPVFRFALHMSGSREIAEEVTQEVFLAMLAGARQYVSQQGSLQAYLIGVARNQVRRQLRHRRANARVDDTSGELRDESGERLLDELSRKQELGALREAILRLPPNYREVVVLCDMEGLDYEQAAAQLSCALGTVRSRLHRARAILQAKLSRKWGREECPA